MNLPLYKGASTPSPEKTDAHRGLVWTRFFDRYAAGFADKPAAGEGGKFIADIASKLCGNENALHTFCARNRDLIENKLGGKILLCKTTGPFTTGLGNDHPTENGFTWHHTLGVPYLPAASVKGLVRAWLEWNCDETALKKDGGDPVIREQLKNWFGSENKDPRECTLENQAGWFIFFDALPSSPVTLSADVMTPHYGDWYEKGGDILAASPVPADWHSPVPVTFLTVKQATFQFGVAVRAGLSATDQDLAQKALPEVMRMLQDALEWLGAGAKTAVGYGRMMLDEKAIQEAARLAEEAARKVDLEQMSANLQKVEVLSGKIKKCIAKENLNGKLHNDVRELLKIAKEPGNWSDAEKDRLKQVIREELPKAVSGMDKDQLKKFKLTEL